MAKRRKVRSAASGRVRRVKKDNHACFMGLCICDHPSFKIAVFVLVATLSLAFYLYFTQ